MIRNEEQIKQILRDVEAVHYFLETIDKQKHRDFIHHVIDRDDGRFDFISTVLADHDYGIKPVTQAYLENKYLSPPAYDFGEFAIEYILI